MSTTVESPPEMNEGSAACAGATCFAPAWRDARPELLRKQALLVGVPLLTRVLDGMPSMVMILNENRQIIAANQPMRAMLGAVDAELVGKRPGEALGCVRAEQGLNGCGTAAHCATCGGISANLETHDTDATVTRECRLLVRTSSGTTTLELRATTSSFRVGGDRFIVAAVEDIGREKQLKVLQRTFFHDLLNTAGCLHGYAEYLASVPSEDPEAFLRLSDLSDQLVEIIHAQRDLMHAESGELAMNPTAIETRQLVEELRAQYVGHPLAANRRIRVADVDGGTLVADRQILLRVLGNMLKNAVEATPPGGTVTLGCLDRGDTLAFTVNNPGVMPEEVQMQVFQRCFTTKGEPGRGIGTHSMKLLGERYLNGAVGFTSRDAEGTTFRLTLPRRPGGQSR